jgi:hypothetical protein
MKKEKRMSLILKMLNTNMKELKQQLNQYCHQLRSKINQTSILTSKVHYKTDQSLLNLLVNTLFQMRQSTKFSMKVVKLSFAVAMMRITKLKSILILKDRFRFRAMEFSPQMISQLEIHENGNLLVSLNKALKKFLKSF